MEKVDQAFSDEKRARRKKKKNKENCILSLKMCRDIKMRE